MTLPVVALVPVLVIVALMFLVAAAAATAVVAGVISVGYSRWRITARSSAPGDADEPGLALVRLPIDECHALCVPADERGRSAHDR